jgi:hypothetical protein
MSHERNLWKQICGQCPFNVAASISLSLSSILKYSSLKVSPVGPISCQQQEAEILGD